MSDGRYVLNFLGQKTRTLPDPDAFRGYFTHYTPEKWRAGVAGGSFKYIDANDKHFDLIVAHSPKHGISLMYNAGKGRDRMTFVSVSDAGAMAEIVDVGVDEFYPVGTFVDPSQAWMVVEAFLTDPTVTPGEPLMVDIEETDWPEMF